MRAGGRLVAIPQWLHKMVVWLPYSSVAQYWLHKLGVLGLIPGDCQPFHLPLFCLKINSLYQGNFLLYAHILHRINTIKGHRRRKRPNIIYTTIVAICAA